MRTRIAAVFVLVTLSGAPAPAQLSVPTVKSSRPVGAAPGETIALEVKGSDLDGVKAIRFDGLDVRVENLKVTNGEVKARVTVPAGAAPGVLSFRVEGPKGVSNAGRLVVGRGSKTVAEVEPNNGFRKPQKLGSGDAVEGRIEPGDDVDVYAVEMKAGETLAAEVVAARAGSGLDALVTVSGPDGRELGEDDDTFGKDAAVAVKAAVEGRYLVTVRDADGKNRDNNIEQQKTRPYRLELATTEPATPTLPPGTPEAEPDDDEAHAQTFKVPGALNGRLQAGKGRDGDIDVFRLVVAPGEEGLYRVSAVAVTLGSLADPVLAALDESGETQLENDDNGGRDARLDRAIGAKGLLVSVRDYYGRGGERFAYRLEVEPLTARGVTVSADLGARVVPKGGSIPLAVTLDRRNYDGPVTLLAGETPDGVSAAPLTIGRGVNAGVVVVSARGDAAPGRFAFRLTTRDAAAPVALVYRERMPVGADPAPGWLAVGEPSTLGVRFEPEEIGLPPGGKATVKVRLDRRGGAAKSAPVKLRFAPADGLEPIAEVGVEGGSDTKEIELKAKPDAAPGGRTLVVLARFETAPEAFAVAAAATVTVREKP